MSEARQSQPAQNSPDAVAACAEPPECDRIQPTLRHYVQAARSALGDRAKNLEASALPPGPRVVKRIELVLGGRFDRYAVAQSLIATSDADVDKETKRRFAALFEAVNTHLAP